MRATDSQGRMDRPNKCRTNGQGFANQRNRTSPTNQRNRTNPRPGEGARFPQRPAIQTEPMARPGGRGTSQCRRTARPTHRGQGAATSIKTTAGSLGRARAPGPLRGRRGNSQSHLTPPRSLPGTRRRRATRSTNLTRDPDEPRPGRIGRAGAACQTARAARTVAKAIGGSLTMRWGTAVGSALALAALLAGGGAGAQTPVDVELVLAVDVSQSMDPGEHQLQRAEYPRPWLGSGRAPARSEAASTAGSRSPMSNGAGRSRRATVVPWTLGRGRGLGGRLLPSVLPAAQPISDHPRHLDLGGALAFAVGEWVLPGQRLRRLPTRHRRLRRRAQQQGARRSRRPATPALTSRVLIINGLPIMLREARGFTPWSIPDLDIYYARLRDRRPRARSCSRSTIRASSRITIRQKLGARHRRRAAGAGAGRRRRP